MVYIPLSDAGNGVVTFAIKLSKNENPFDGYEQVFRSPRDGPELETVGAPSDKSSLRFLAVVCVLPVSRMVFVRRATHEQASA